MIHKIAIAVALLSILYIVYSSLNGYVMIWTLFVLAISAAIYYMTTSLVTKGMVNKKEKKETISYKAGLVNKSNLIPGRLAFDSGKIVFYKRENDLGGVTPSFIIANADLQSYNIGKINEYHSGIRLTAKDQSVYELKCSDIIKNEDLFVSTIGFVSKDEEENT